MIQVRVFCGSTPPYYLKEQGKLKGTFIRVGSKSRVANEMKNYPTIELRWKEVGLSFQVQFIKRDFKPTKNDDVGPNVGVNVGVNSSLANQIFELIRNNQGINVKEINTLCDKMVN